MTSPREPDRLIQAFLDDGPTELPMRTYDNVRDHIDRTRQRVVIGPWREPSMNTIVRAAAAIAAVLVLAFGASQLLPSSSGVGTGPPSPSPTAPSTASPSASGAVLPTPSPVTLTVPAPYPATITFQVRPGWRLWGAEGEAGQGWYKESPDPPGMGFTFWTAKEVFAEPCGGGFTTVDPPVGPTVDDLADVLIKQPATIVNADRPITVDGYSGRFLDYTADYSRGCAAGHLNRWRTVSGSIREALDGERDQVWILDVKGKRIIIDAFEFPSTSAADKAELRTLIDTVQISPN
jgi:hypothetical protein